MELLRCCALSVVVMLVLENGALSRKTIWAFFGARAREAAVVLGSAAEGSRRQRIDLHERFTHAQAEFEDGSGAGVVAL